MGRPVLPFTRELYREEESWGGFRRALRRGGRELFDALFAAGPAHTPGGPPRGGGGLSPRLAAGGPRALRRAVRGGPLPHRGVHLRGEGRSLRCDPDEHPRRGAPGGAGIVETGRGSRTAAGGEAGGMPRRELTGWVFDIAASPGGMTVWFRTATGETTALFAPFRPSFVLARGGVEGA